jgi:hypothetical protein
VQHGYTIKRLIELIKSVITLIHNLLIALSAFMENHIMIFIAWIFLLNVRPEPI